MAVSWVLNRYPPYEIKLAVVKPNNLGGIYFQSFSNNLSITILRPQKWPTHRWSSAAAKAAFLYFDTDSSALLTRLMNGWLTLRKKLKAFIWEQICTDKTHTSQRGLHWGLCAGTWNSVKFSSGSSFDLNPELELTPHFPPAPSR